MSDSVLEFAANLFVGPVWPASILVCLLAIYTTFALIGLVDLDVDMPEIDAPDLDVPDLNVPGVDLSGVDADVGDVGFDVIQGIGAATVRWTNFGRVPIVIWGGVFTLGFWVISYMLWHGFDVRHYDPTLVASTLLTIRNVVLATAIAKAVTQPMIRHFVATPPYNQSRLIGATCEIISPEVTSESGQARFRTDAAPLLLNVRTNGPHIRKGEEVRIVSFDSLTRIYQVTHLSSEQTS